MFITALQIINILFIKFFHSKWYNLQKKCSINILPFKTIIFIYNLWFSSESKCYAFINLKILTIYNTHNVYRIFDYFYNLYSYTYLSNYTSKEE